MLKIIKKSIPLFLPFLIALPAFAQKKNFNWLVGKLNQAGDWFFTIFILIAVIFIILTAFSYLTAGGDAEKIEKAKKQLIYVVVAIVIAVLSKSIPLIIQNFIAGNGSGTETYGPAY